MGAWGRQREEVVRRRGAARRALQAKHCTPPCPQHRRCSTLPLVSPPAPPLPRPRPPAPAHPPPAPRPRTCSASVSATSCTWSLSSPSGSMHLAQNVGTSRSLRPSTKGAKKSARRLTSAEVTMRSSHTQ